MKREEAAKGMTVVGHSTAQGDGIAAVTVEVYRVGGEGLEGAVHLQRLLHRRPHPPTRPHLHPDACSHRQAGTQNTNYNLISRFHSAKIRLSE